MDSKFLEDISPFRGATDTSVLILSLISKDTFSFPIIFGNKTRSYKVDQG